MAGTILYIDDAPELPEGFDRELRRLGYQLRQSADPEEGLRLARQAPPQLVLLEVLLSSCDGFELLEELRSAAGDTNEMPVVIVTRGERTPRLYGRAVELGANDFLCKPVLRAELLASVLRFARRGGPASPADPADPERVASVEAALSGDLAECPLPELLLRLRRIGATGVLLVQHEVENRGIQFRNGSPVAVSSNRRVEALEDFLVRTKRISGAEHEVVTEQVIAALGSPREILLGAGILSDEEVSEALRQRAAEPLLEGFDWTTGNYRFQVGSRLKPERALEFEQSPGRLIIKGALEWAPTAMIRERLEQRSSHYVSRVERPPYTLAELGPEACDPTLVEELVGDRTVAEILASNEGEERLLYGLLIAGLVEVHPEPTLVLNEALEPVVEAPAPHETELPEEAADARAIEEAAENTGELPQSADRSLDAEAHFREGEKFLLRKRYDKAVEAFGMAAHLDPSEAEYSAHLGYALHLSQPKNALVRREALEHIATAVKRAPGQWKPLVFLGRVFAAAGEKQNARKVLLRALRVQPDCHAARQELKLLDRPDRRGWWQRLLERFGR